MTVVSLTPVGGRLIQRLCADSDRRTAYDLLDLSEQARRKGDSELADRLLLAAWSAYDL